MKTRGGCHVSSLFMFRFTRTKPILRDLLWLTQQEKYTVHYVIMKPDPVSVGKKKYTHSANASLSPSPQEVNTLCFSAFESHFLTFRSHISLRLYLVCVILKCSLIFFSPLYFHFHLVSYSLSFLLHSPSLSHTHR